MDFAHFQSRKLWSTPPNGPLDPSGHSKHRPRPPIFVWSQERRGEPGALLRPRRHDAALLRGAALRGG